MSCSIPLMANISAKPLSGAPLSWVYYGHGQGTLPGALFFTHHISQAIESVAATDCLLIVSLSPWYCGFDSFIIEIIRPGFYLKLDQDL